MTKMVPVLFRPQLSRNISWSLRCRQAYRAVFTGSFSSRRFSAQPWQEEDPAFSPTLHPHHHDTEESLRAHHHRNHNRHHVPNEPLPKIGRLVLVRHGQSEWNVTDSTRNLTARFTGWADIGLTQQGKDQAIAAGRAIQFAAEEGIIPSNLVNDVKIPAIDVAFCSLLKRASDTMNLVLEEIHLAKPMALETENIFHGITSDSGDKVPTPYPNAALNAGIGYQYNIPIVLSWRLNERHYGALVGLSKEGAERLYGKVRLTRWRDSWEVAPPPMPLEMVQRWGREDHCQPVTIVRKARESIKKKIDDEKNAHVHDKSGVKIVEHGKKRKERQKKQNASSTDASSFSVSDKEVSSYSSLENNTITDPPDETTMPPSESLRDAYERALPIWIQGISPHLRAGKTVLVVGHANTIRSMLFAIDPDVVKIENMKKVKIPSALPLVYEFVSGSTDAKSEHGGKIPGFGNSEPSDKNITKSIKVNGRECSSIIPGNLRVLKSSHQYPRSDPFSDESRTKNLKEGNEQEKKKEVRHQLNGVWIETEETDSVSFCTDLGQSMLEHEIA